LASVSRSVTNGGTQTYQEKAETYYYDGLARRYKTSTVLRNDVGINETFVTELHFDSYYGRAKQQDYPSGDKVWLRYSKYGHLSQESDVASGTDYRKINTIDGRGQTKQEILGGLLESN